MNAAGIFIAVSGAEKNSSLFQMTLEYCYDLIPEK